MSEKIQLSDGRQVDLMEANDVIRDILRDCDRGDPLSIFADRYPLATLENWENAIETRGKMWDVTSYAKRVKGADIDRLQNVVHQRGDAYDIHMFAVRVNGADLKKALDRLYVILDTEDPNKIDPDIHSYVRNLQTRIDGSQCNRSANKPR